MFNANANISCIFDTKMCDNGIFNMLFLFGFTFIMAYLKGDTFVIQLIGLFTNISKYCPINFYYPLDILTSLFQILIYIYQ